MGGIKLGEISRTIMEEENLIVKNWQQQVKIFTENLAICRKRPTKNSVHDLRVAIKRMRSYLQLEQKLKGSKWKDQFANTSVLFKFFGKLRDFDMSLTLTRRYGNNKPSSFISFKQFLAANRNLARRLAREEAIKYNDHQFHSLDQQFTLLSIQMPGEEVQKMIIQLSVEKLKKVRSLADQFEENAHEIRKILKIIYYWLKICPPQVTDDVINLKELDKALNNLGNWQDHFILRKKINRFIKEQPVKNEEKEKLKELKTTLAGEQKKLLDKAKKKWKDIANERGD